MARDIAALLRDRLGDGEIIPIIAVELLFNSGAVRMWTGVGTLVIGGNSYVGALPLLSISSVEETTQIIARGAELTLSGLDAGVLGTALTEPYQGRRARILLGSITQGTLLQESSDFLLQENGDRILLEDESTNLTELFSGFMDVMRITDSAETSTITLSVENKLLDLERARVFKYASSTQRKRFPGDRGFDFVQTLQDKEIVWG